MPTLTYVKEAADERYELLELAAKCHDQAWVGDKPTAITQIAALIAQHLSKLSEWVDVRDRLPEHEQIVLALEGARIFLTPYFRGNENHQIDEWSDAEDMRNGVTHWMPLPQPPIAKEKV